MFAEFLLTISPPPFHFCCCLVFAYISCLVSFWFVSAAWGIYIFHLVLHTNTWAVPKPPLGIVAGGGRGGWPSETGRVSTSQFLVEREVCRCVGCEDRSCRHIFTLFHRVFVYMFFPFLVWSPNPRDGLYLCLVCFYSCFGLISGFFFGLVSFAIGGKFGGSSSCSFLMLVLIPVGL